MAKDYADKYMLQVFLSQHGELIYDQCHTINPSNPLAVARNIEKMIDALEQISTKLANPLTTRTSEPLGSRVQRASDESHALALRILADIKKET